jgi:hypothetical protein
MVQALQTRVFGKCLLLQYNECPLREPIKVLSQAWLKTAPQGECNPFPDTGTDAGIICPPPAISLDLDTGARTPHSDLFVPAQALRD